MLKIKRNVIMIGIFIVVGIVAFNLSKCSKPIAPSNGANPVVFVTPTTITHAVQQQLPAGQTAHQQVDIPHVTPVPGIISTQHVVVTNVGNTLVVTTNAIDWGFRFKPALVVGFDNKAFGGLGVDFFQVWRFNTTALLTVSGKNLDTDIRLGLGESYLVFDNTSIGVAYQMDSTLNKHLGFYISLRF